MNRVTAQTDETHAGFRGAIRALLLVASLTLCTACEPTASPELSHYVLRGHNLPVYDLRFSDPGDELLSAGADALRRWDWRGQRAIVSMGGNGGAVRAGYDRGFVIGLYADSALRNFDLETGRLTRHQAVKNWATAYKWALSPDSKRAALANGREIVAWNVDPLEKILEDAGSLGPVVVQLRFSGDSNALIGIDDTGKIARWSIGKRPTIATGARCQADSTSLAVDATGSRILVGGARGVIEAIELGPGARLFETSAHSGPVAALAVSPSGRLAISGGNDGCTRVWDFGTGKLIRTFKTHRDAVRSVAFAPDEGWIAAGGGTQLRQHDLFRSKSPDCSIHVLSLADDAAP